MRNEPIKSPQSQEKVLLVHFFLKSLLWNQHVSKPFQLLCLIFSNLQCTAILTWILLHCLIINHNESLSIASRVISGVISIRRLFTFNIDHTTATFVIMAIILCYFVVIAILLSILITNYWKTHHKADSKDKAIVYISQFHLNIGFWLINMACMDYLASGLFSTAGLNLDPDQLAGSGIYIIFIIFNYLFGLLFAVYSYDPFMSSNLLSCHSCGAQVSLFLFKAVLAPMIAIMESSVSQNWVLTVFPVVILGLAWYNLVATFPYYQYLAMKISLNFSGTNFLISLANFIVMIIKSTGNTPSEIVIYILVLLIPLLIKIVATRLDAIISKYLAMQNNQMKSKGDVIKKLFSLSSVSSKAILTINNETNKSRDELQLWGAVSKITIEKAEHSDEEQLNFSDGRYTINELCHHYTKIGKNLIRHVLQHAIASFPQHSLFKVLFARFAIENNLPFLATSLCIADTIKFEGQSKLVAMSLKQALQENIDGYFDEATGKVIHLKNYLDMEEASNKLTAAIKSVSQNYIMFWAKYFEPHLLMKEFYEKSKEIEAEADKIDKIWKSSANKDRVFAHNFCSAYSLYLSHVRSSPYAAHKVIRKYYSHHLEEVYSLANENTLSDNNLISPYVIAFYAAMTPANAGKVLNHSQNLTNLLGWTADDLQGKNIEKVLPAFMGETHLKLLAKHIQGTFEGKTGARMYKTIDSLILHKNGHLVPCEVYLSIHPYVHDEPKYMVLVRIKNVKGDCLLVSRKGIVEGYTYKIGQTLRLNADQRVHLTSLCQHSLELEEVLHAPVLQAGIERSSAKLEKVIQKRNEILDRRRSSRRIFEKKTIFESIHAMKRTFSINFHVSKVSSRGKGPGIRPYSVHLSPQFFGDLFYFLLELEHEVPDEATLQFLSNTKSLHHRSMRNETDFTVEDSPASENEPGVLPLFPSGKLTATTIPQVTCPVTLISEVTNQPILKNHINKAFDFELAKNTSIDKSSDQGSPKPHIPMKSPYSLKVDNIYSEENVALSPGRFGMMSPTNSVRPLVHALSDTWDEQNSTTKGGKTLKGVKLHMAASSVGTSRTGTGKIEKAAKIVPKNKNVKALYIVMLSFMLIFCAPLLGFHFSQLNILNLVQSSVGAISTSIFRLVRITDIGQYVRNIWQARNGMLASDRYARLGWPEDTGDQLIEQTADIFTDLNNKNNQLRSYIHQLDAKLQSELYADRLPIYETDANGNIVSYRTGNTFDIVTQLVSEGIQFLTSGVPINGQNSHLLFVLNNTFNDVLAASERTIGILTEDNTNKLTNQEQYLYITMSFLGVIGLIILVFFFNILKEFAKDRRHFISIFPMLNQNMIEKQLQQVQSFLNMLENVSGNSQGTTQVDIRAISKFNAAKAKDSRQIKKPISTKGINMLLMILYIGGILFVGLLFSAYPVLIVNVKASNTSVLTKMTLMEKSDLNLFYTNFLLTSIYEYVQENATTRVINQPIKSKWEQIYSDMSSSISFLLIEILKPGNGLSDNPQLEQVIRGNLCAIIDIDDINLERMCRTMGGGVVERGIIGLDGYIMASVREVKDYFDSSPKTWDDMVHALSLEGLVNIEAFYPFTLSSVQWVDRLIRSGMAADFDNYEQTVMSIVVIYLVLYIVVGGILCRKITKKLEEEMNHWRKILRQIPHQIIVENKLLNGYLSRINNGMLE